MDEKKLSRKERRVLAKERGDDWRTSELNNRVPEQKYYEARATERERRAKARRADEEAMRAIMAIQIDYLFGQR